MDVNNEEQDCVCDVCGKTFRHESSLKRHIQIHKGELHPCLQCSKTFSTDFYLSAHVARKHTTKKKLLCSHCGQCYNSKVALSNHMRFKHTQNGIQCSTCSKHFKDRYALGRHEETHTQVKSECSKCQKMFRDINSHIVKCQGKQVRKFQCDLCQQKFLSKRNLKKHLKCKHESPDSYRCGCGKVFSYSYSLKRHERVCLKH